MILMVLDYLQNHGRHGIRINMLTVAVYIGMRLRPN